MPSARLLLPPPQGALNLVRKKWSMWPEMAWAFWYYIPTAALQALQLAWLLARPRT